MKFTREQVDKARDERDLAVQTRRVKTDLRNVLYTEVNALTNQISQLDHFLNLANLMGIED